MNPIEPMAMSEAITIARRSSRKSPDPWRNCWLSCVGVIEFATHVGCRLAVARETNQLLLVELDCDRVHAITLFPLGGAACRFEILCGACAYRNQPPTA